VLNSLFSLEESPASVHTTNLDSPNSSMIVRSRGLSVTCSEVLPGVMRKASGMPSASMNRPICTIGLGRCSLETPYCRSPPSSAPSTSKK
jgi:hypothetical protein